MLVNNKECIDKKRRKEKKKTDLFCDNLYVVSTLATWSYWPNGPISISQIAKRMTTTKGREKNAITLQQP